MPTRYYISLPDPARARGGDAALAFRAQGADGFAAELQDALRSDGLFERWRAQQDDPDEIDPALGATDANATVSGRQDDLHVDLVQPVHTGEEGKEVSLSTLINIASAVVEEGLATGEELDAAIAELEAFTKRPDTLIGFPRVFQVWGRRAA